MLLDQVNFIFCEYIWNLSHWLWIWDFHIFYFLSELVLPYNYGMPNEWCDAFKQCCGSKQSPINLELPEETDDKIPCIFKFEGYEQTPKGMDISNQGNTGNIITELYVFSPFNWQAISGFKCPYGKGKNFLKKIWNFL